MGFSSTEVFNGPSQQLHVFFTGMYAQNTRFPALPYQRGLTAPGPQGS
jgi:hypothetical protein